MIFAVIDLQFAVIILQFAVIILQFAVISLQFAVIDLQNIGLLWNHLQPNYLSLIRIIEYVRDENKSVNWKPGITSYRILHMFCSKYSFLKRDAPYDKVSFPHKMLN